MNQINKKNFLYLIILFFQLNQHYLRLGVNYIIYLHTLLIYQKVIKKDN